MDVMPTLDSRFASGLLQVLDQAAQISVTDAQERITAVNETFCETYGYRREELLGSSHRILSSGTHPPRFWEDMRRTIRAGGTWRQVICNRTRSGDLVWVDTLIAPLPGGDGYASIRHDVTKQMRLQGRLAIKERLLTGASQLMQLGGWSANLRLNLVQWTSKAELLLGLPPTGTLLTWTGFLELLGRSTTPAAAEALAGLAEDGGSWAWEGRSADGARWLQLSAEVTRDALGQVQLEGAVQDITARKEAELALAAARRTAEEAVAARDRYIAVLGHEMRNPLQGLLGGLHLLIEAQEPARKDEHARLALQGGRLLLRLLDDILDLAKLEAGRFAITVRPCSPRAIVAAVADLYAAQARRLGLAFSTSVADAVPARLLLDELRLTQVLSNLVANALKFTPAGEVGLRLDMAGTGDELVLTVTDSGIGIPPEARDRLFQPFSQVHGGTASTYGGTGLGLWICGSLVRAMGGTIAVASNPGAGSAFTIRLPAHAAAEERQGPAQTGSVDRLAGHVLLVEDDELGRLVVQRTLEAIGLACTAVGSAEEALKVWQRDHAAFNLLITDLELPGIDGRGLVARLRADPHGSQIPCVALSGHAPAGQLAEYGFAATLLKPLTIAAARAALGPFLPAR